MSGITPILDTLLHQVLGKRVDIPVIKDQPLPVSAATSSDAIQPARSDSRLHQQGGDPIASAASAAGREGSLNPVGASSQTGTASTQLHLSQTATQIADILARFPATQTASVRPLVALLQPGAGADSLASALSQSVRDSGVFYESHLQRWLSGQYPLQALMREPQAWLGLTFRPFMPGSSSNLLSSAFHVWGGHRDATFRSQAIRSTTNPAQPPGAQANEVTGDSRSAVGSAAEKGGMLRDMPASASFSQTDTRPLSATRGHQLSQSASESLQTLVRHQLELIVSPNLRWEGQLWPGVPMTLILSELPGGKPSNPDVEEAPRRSRQGAEEGSDEWRADVQIRLPSLGLIDLAFRARRDAPLSVEIDPAEDTARQQIEPKLALLHERLERLGVTAAVAVGSTSRGVAEDE